VLSHRDSEIQPNAKRAILAAHIGTFRSEQTDEDRLPFLVHYSPAASVGARVPHWLRVHSSPRGEQVALHPVYKQYVRGLLGGQVALLPFALAVGRFHLVDEQQLRGQLDSTP
jgi:hypothetical protein